MAQISWMVHEGKGTEATTTLTIPTWAPDIRYASTGSCSRTLECLMGTTTLGLGINAGESWPEQIDLKSYSARKVRLVDNTAGIPVQVTFRYEAVGELTRT